MDLLTAQLVFFAIMTIAVCVWCHSLVRALQLGTTVDEEPEQWLASTAPETSMADRLVGSELVRGEQETVSRTIAKALLQHGTMFEITERTTDQVLATRTMSAHSDPNAIQCDGVGFALKRAGADTVEIVYCLDFGARRKRLRIAIFAILFGLGLPLLLGIGLVIWLYVIPSPMPGMRWQVLQTLQVCHALWPPFMLIHRYKAAASNGQAFVKNLITAVSLADGVDKVR